MKARQLGFAVAILVLALDQLSKWWVLGPLALREQVNGIVQGQIYLLPIFNFTYTENQGISLGLLNATNPVGRWMLVALTSGIAVGVAVWIGKEKNRIDQVALGMVLGGALGNILDRVRHGFVTDFLDLHFGEFRPFLVFNIGDAAISIAVVILLLRAFLTRKDDAKGPGPEETIEHA
jgi:signal peptidase II